MNLLQKFRNELEKRKLWEVFTYLFFGVCTTIVNIVIHLICLDILNFHYMVATVISWLGAVLFAFVTNKKWVFHSSSSTASEWWTEFLRFIFYRLISLVLDMGSMFLMIDLLKIDGIVAKVLTQVLVVIANYVFSKFLIFTKGNKNK